MGSAEAPQFFADGSNCMKAKDLPVGQAARVNRGLLFVSADGVSWMSPHTLVYALSHASSRRDCGAVAIERMEGREPLFKVTCAPGERINGQTQFLVTIH